ncbi:uncharacterized protein LOC135169045 [Diachasmimorpha longicaudata]|uniref:uncharacterized protein LOC135169045 n=1 Tax=Diachasmimorpha longicaudata TaxID=58733 RepID=UPI0030B8CF5B
MNLTGRLDGCVYGRDANGISNGRRANYLYPANLFCYARPIKAQRNRSSHLRGHQGLLNHPHCFVGHTEGQMSDVFRATRRPTTPTQSFAIVVSLICRDTVSQFDDFPHLLLQSVILQHCIIYWENEYSITALIAILLFFPSRPSSPFPRPME